MSTGQIVLKILTPVGSVISEEASMVIIPSVNGETGILPGHAPTLFRIDPGLVKIYTSGKLSNTLFCFGGFAKINDDQLYILADKTSSVHDLDVAEAKANLETFEREILTLADTKLLPHLEAKAHLARKIIEVSQYKN